MLAFRRKFGTCSDAERNELKVCNNMGSGNNTEKNISRILSEILFTLFIWNRLLFMYLYTVRVGGVRDLLDGFLILTLYTPLGTTDNYNTMAYLNTSQFIVTHTHARAR
jgi:hypothetical protein